MGGLLGFLVVSLARDFFALLVAAERLSPLVINMDETLVALGAGW